MERPVNTWKAKAKDFELKPAWATQQDPTSNKTRKMKLDLLAQVYNPNCPAEAPRLQIQGLCVLCSKFTTGVGNLAKPCLKKINKRP